MAGEVLLNNTGSPGQGCRLLASNDADGRYTVTNGKAKVSLQPIASVTVSVVVNTPAMVKVCVTEGTPMTLEPPSPNSQKKLVNATPLTSVLRSVNVVVNGQQPNGGATVKLASGLAAVI